MIANLTAAEWDAVIGAFALADAEWEDAEETASSLAERRNAQSRRKGIERAQGKIAQIAPTIKGGRPT